MQQTTKFNCKRCAAPIRARAIQCPNCGQMFSRPVPAFPFTSYRSIASNEWRLNPNFIANVLTVEIVASVLAVLALIVLPAFAPEPPNRQHEIAEIRDLAHERIAQAGEVISVVHLQEIGEAVYAYEQSHEGRLPPTGTLNGFRSALSAFLPRSRTNDLFSSPGTNMYYFTNRYVAKRPIDSISDPATVDVMVCDGEDNPDGLSSVLYADGHVQTVPKLALEAELYADSHTKAVRVRQVNAGKPPGASAFAVILMVACAR